MKPKLLVENIEISKLIAYENNAKLHPREQIEQIKKSIVEFGFLDPIACDENYVILEGHGRLLASQEIGLKEVPVFQVLNLSEAEKRAYRIAHNKLTLNSDFDFDLLKVDLSFLEDVNFDIALTGFDTDELTENNEENEEQISEAKEIDVDEMMFDHKCPKCGFEFDD